MDIILKVNKDLIWQSDWNGYEVGYPNSDIVSLYQINNTEMYIYVDPSSGKILDGWKEDDF